jgi:hypothetical protein
MALCVEAIVRHVNLSKGVMKSVPSRGSVGSTIRWRVVVSNRKPGNPTRRYIRRVVMGQVDPTLPRDGTDLVDL